MIKGLVSVIITTYARDTDLLFVAIDSVRRQSYEPIEIIVVDDNGFGSEQQRRNAQSLASQPDVRYIANDKNTGAQFSRNIGLLNARGEYVAFLDDDDVWLPSKIEKQVRVLEDQGCDMVFCNGYRVSGSMMEAGTLYQRNFVSDRPITFDMQLESDRIGSTSNPLIRKSCLAKTGLFDFAMPARQDYEMWLRVCKQCKVQGIDEPLFFYRCHQGERITRSLRRDLEASLLLWEKYKKDYMRNRKARARAQFGLAVVYFKMKRPMRALFHACFSFVSSPDVTASLLWNHIKGKPQF